MAFIVITTVRLTCDVLEDYAEWKMTSTEFFFKKSANLLLAKLSNSNHLIEGRPNLIQYLVILYTFIKIKSDHLFTVLPH